jgi:hypothetical protein
MDIAWRVLPVRAYSVKRSLEVLTSRGPGSETLISIFFQRFDPLRLELLALLLPKALGKSDCHDELDTRYDSTTKGA